MRDAHSQKGPDDGIAWSLPGEFVEQDENETGWDDPAVSFSFDPLVPCRARQHPPAAQDDPFARGQPSK